MRMGLVGVIVVGLLLVLGGEGRRDGIPDTDFVYNKIYTSIQHAAPCIRLTTKDGEVGCGSKFEGNWGYLWEISNEGDLLNFQAEGQPPSSPIVLVVAQGMWGEPVVQAALQKGDQIQGILVDLTAEDPPSLSVADKYPNKAFSLYPDSEYEWNPTGTSLSSFAYPFPIFALTDSDELSSALEGARENLKSSSPTWAAHLSSFMNSAIDTPTCIRRGFCEPLGSQSVLSSPLPYDSSKPVIFAIAPMDTTSFFHEFAVGGSAEVAGMAVLLSAYDALVGSDSLSTLPSQLMFAFFNGEAYGYLGSRKFVNDLTNFQCKKPSEDGDSCLDPYMPSLNFTKIEFNNIQHVLEVNQVGSVSEGKFFTYADGQSEDTEPIFEALEDGELGTGVTVRNSAVAEKEGIPPSSLMSFLREKRELSGVVLTDHDGPYRNQFYHSDGDNFENIKNLDQLCGLASTVARSLFFLAGGGEDMDETDETDGQIDLNANCSLVGELTECLASNWSCPLVTNYLGQQLPGSYPAPEHYVSTFKHLSNIRLTEAFLYRFLKAPPSIKKDNEDCTENCEEGEGEDEPWTFYHGAVSSYFKCENMGNSHCREWGVREGDEGSSFTESYWANGFSVRIFQREENQPWMFIFGFIQLLITLVAAKYIWPN